MAHSAVKVLFSGRVQGVGFRFTTARLAERFAVSGTVRNLPDGRVEVIAEGERAELERFLGAIRARMGGYIHDEEATWLPASGGYRGFRIAF